MNYLSDIAFKTKPDSYKSAVSVLPAVQASKYDPKHNRWIEGKILDNGEVVYDDSDA